MRYSIFELPRVDHVVKGLVVTRYLNVVPPSERQAPAPQLEVTVTSRTEH